jgi:hypothetical protein
MGGHGGGLASLAVAEALVLAYGDRRVGSVGRLAMSFLLVPLFFTPLLLILASVVHIMWSCRTITIDERRRLTSQPDPVGGVLGYALPRLAQSRWRAAPSTAGDTAILEAPENTTILERRYRPAWTIVVSVMLFPVGLLALVIRTRHVITIAAQGDELIAVGWGSTWSRDVVAEAVDAVVDASNAH